MAYDATFNQENGQKVLLYGVLASDGETLKLCKVDGSGSLIYISHQHSKVHQGVYYNTGHYFDSVADATTVFVYLKLSANFDNHAVIQVGNGGDAKLDLYEDPTTTDNGTSISIINHNRVLALASPITASSSTAFHTPSFNSPSVYGTQLIPGLVLPGGTKDKGGGAISEAAGEQWVFAAGHNYLIAITNMSGSAQDISVDIAYYEVAA